MFLNTCRLWYHGCPKYRGYHYASQFVYSKAEKGKSIGGMSPAQARQTGFGGVSPTGLGGVSSSGLGGIMGSGVGFGMSSGVSTPFGGMGMGTSIG